MDSLLSKQHAAKVLGVSTKTVDRMIAAGSLEVTRIGRCIRIRQEDLKALRERKYIPTT